MLSLDGGNSALVIAFSRDQFWDLENTIFKGISEPQKIALTKARLLKHGFPVHGSHSKFLSFGTARRP